MTKKRGQINNNFILFVINLMPLPPLDGSAIISLFLPTDMARNYQQAMQDPGIQFMGLLIVLIIFRVVVGPIWRTAVWLLSCLM